MSLKLRTVFSGAFAVIIILLSALLSYVIGKQSTASVEVSIGSALTEVAYQMSEKLDHFMWSRSGEVEVLSKLSAFQEPVDSGEVSALLNQLKKSMPVFTWVGYLDAEGNVVSSTDNILQGKNINQRPVFQEGIKGKFIGDVHDAVLLAKLLPNPTGEALQFVDVSVPIEGKQGQKNGVLAAHFSWEWSRQVEQSILAPLEERMKGVEVFVISKKDDTILVGPKQRVGQKMTGQALQHAQKSENGWMIESDAEGTSYLTGYAYGDGYLDYPGLGWSVIIRQPADIAFAAVRQLERFIIVTGLVAAALFGILGWFLAGWIVRPLNNIARTADQLAAGENVELPKINRYKEVAALSSSLRNLVTNLTRTETALGFMSDIAHHDVLTGLPNRMALNDFLIHAMNRAKQKGGTLSFLYLDLDGFKKVNDTLGHASGDKLLQEIAFRLQECTRDNEIVVRLGGDEFVVVLHTSAAKPMQESEVVATRIINTINEPVIIEGNPVHVGCSIGAAVWSSDSGQDTRETMCLADEALYISKRSGKNRITFEANA